MKRQWKQGNNEYFRDNFKSSLNGLYTTTSLKLHYTNLINFI